MPKAPKPTPVVKTRIPVTVSSSTSFKVTEDQILFALHTVYNMPVFPKPATLRIVQPPVATPEAVWILRFETEENSTCEGKP